MHYIYLSCSHFPKQIICINKKYALATHSTNRIKICESLLKFLRATLMHVYAISLLKYSFGILFK